MPQNADYFNEEYENMALDFLRQYDNSRNAHSVNVSAVEEIINGKFTIEEIECAIDTLKSNKSPGNDCIPAEFIKVCKIFSLRLLPLFLITRLNEEIFQMPGSVESVLLCLSLENAMLLTILEESQYYW